MGDYVDVPDVLCRALQLRTRDRADNLAWALADRLNFDNPHNPPAVARILDDLAVHLAIALEDGYEVLDRRHHDIAAAVVEHLRIEDLYDLVRVLGATNARLNCTIDTLPAELERLAATRLSTRIGRLMRKWEKDGLFRHGRPDGPAAADRARIRPAS